MREIDLTPIEENIIKNYKVEKQNAEPKVNIEKIYKKLLSHSSKFIFVENSILIKLSLKLLSVDKKSISILSKILIYGFKKHTDILKTNLNRKTDIKYINFIEKKINRVSLY